MSYFIEDDPLVFTEVSLISLFEELLDNMIRNPSQTSFLLLLKERLFSRIASLKETLLQKDSSSSHASTVSSPGGSSPSDVDSDASTIFYSIEH